MSYIFKGVLIGDNSIGAEDAARLFEGYSREISRPFDGVIVSFDEEKWDVGEEELKTKILEKSQILGDSTLVYIYYSTWAGPCDYCHAFACRNGHIIEEKAGEEKAGNDVLCEMQGHMGVMYPSSDFAPFERGFFPNT